MVRNSSAHGLMTGIGKTLHREGLRTWLKAGSMKDQKIMTGKNMDITKRWSTVTSNSSVVGMPDARIASNVSTGESDDKIRI